MDDAGSLGQARVVGDSCARIEAVGAHAGARRVYAYERAPDGQAAVVFGGSSSLATPHQQGLCWFLAQVFREVHFVWIPFGWDSEYLRRVGAEVDATAP